MKQATCKPIETLVSTVPADERDPTVFYYPSCVLVSQCGGCCAHSGTTCSPTEESEKQVFVKKTKYAGGQKLVAVGNITVTVKEHTKCRCQCKKTASDCNSLQKFVANQCRCECMNLDQAESCSKVRKNLKFSIFSLQFSDFSSQIDSGTLRAARVFAATLENAGQVKSSIKAHVPVSR